MDERLQAYKKESEEAMGEVLKQVKESMVRFQSTELKIKSIENNVTKQIEECFNEMH